MGPEDNFCSTKIQKNKDSVLALLSDLIWGFRRCEFKIRTMEPKKYCPFLHFSSKEKGFPVVKSGVWGHFPHYSRVRLNWEVALDFRFGHWKWPNREWEKGHFSKWKWLFLTLGSGTSSAWKENLRPLLNTHVPLFNGKYGLRNHFWPLESRFLMRKSEKNDRNFLGYMGRILKSIYLESSYQIWQLG